ncbi:hypothetical protein MBLNU457_g2640t1 [Dothideomycetes sp. NU457]
MPPHFVLGLMGSSPSGGSSQLSTPEQLTSLLNLASSHGIRDLDTARAYLSGGAETLLGSIPKEVTNNFRIDTKAPAFSPNSLSHDKILSNCTASLSSLQEEKCHIYYLHGPDSATPLAEKVDAIAALHNQGKFKHWGVSNIGVEELRGMVEYCRSRDYPLPKVYQGVYNPLHRSVEQELFPLLREYGMVFYAYSPLAGGIFAKGVDEVRSPEKGSRFDVMSVFGGMYLDEQKVEGVKMLAQKCEESGISLLEATIRWFRWHSGLQEGDGVILGVSRQAQLEQTAKFLQGEKLDASVAGAFEQLWEKLKGNALPFSF